MAWRVVSTYWIPGLGAHLLRHPLNASTVLRAVWRLRQRDWWRHAPYLPVPYRPYWNFRLTTVNGTSGKLPTPQDVVDAATWSLLQRVGQ
jgi:hypothetical protein